MRRARGRVLQCLGQDHQNLLFASAARLVQQQAQGERQAKSSQSRDGFKWMPDQALVLPQSQLRRGTGLHRRRSS